MSLYPEYLKEREGKEILETVEGFITYKFHDDTKECYIVDIYTKPYARKAGYAAKMADRVTEIAKGHGCKYLTGSVSPPAKGSHESMLVLIAYGMKLLRADKDMIYFVKEIH